jgi:hypothetical protein
MDMGLLSQTNQQMNPVGLLSLLANRNNSNPMMNIFMQMAMQKAAQTNQAPPQITQTNSVVNDMLHPIDKIMNAIGKFESGGNYSAIGPVTKSGDRAFGRYQVMGNNIGPWSEAALGRRVTTDEFLNNPQIQDQIARHRMQQYYDKYQDPREVASLWFSGRPMKNNFSRDVLGTSVPRYIENVMKYF